MGLAAFLATGASEKKKIDQGPPTNSTSKDEEAFIQYVTKAIGTMVIYSPADIETESSLKMPMRKNRRRNTDLQARRMLTKLGDAEDLWQY